MSTLIPTSIEKVAMRREIKMNIKIASAIDKLAWSRKTLKRIGEQVSRGYVEGTERTSTFGRVVSPWNRHAALRTSQNKRAPLVSDMVNVMPKKVNKNPDVVMALPGEGYQQAGKRAVGTNIYGELLKDKGVLLKNKDYSHKPYFRGRAELDLHRLRSNASRAGRTGVDSPVGMRGPLREDGYIYSDGMLRLNKYKQEAAALRKELKKKTTNRRGVKGSKLTRDDVMSVVDDEFDAQDLIHMLGLK